MTNYFSDIGEHDVIVLDGDGDESAVSMAQPAPQSETPTGPGSCSCSSLSLCGGSSQMSSMLSQPGPSGVTSPHPQGAQNVDTLLSLFSTRFTAKLCIGTLGIISMTVSSV